MPFSLGLSFFTDEPLVLLSSFPFVYRFLNAVTFDTLYAAGYNRKRIEQANGVSGSESVRMKREAGANPAQQPLLCLDHTNAHAIGSPPEKARSQRFTKSISQETCLVCVRSVSWAREKRDLLSDDRGNLSSLVVASPAQRCVFDLKRVMECSMAATSGRGTVRSNGWIFQQTFGRKERPNGSRKR